MIRSQQIGNPIVRWGAPADANPLTLYTADRDVRPMLNGIHISSVLTGDATVTITNGATVYPILTAYTLAANDYLALNDLQMPLEDGEILKVTDSTGGQLTFAAKILERPGGLGGEVVQTIG